MLLTGKKPIFRARSLFAMGVMALVVGVWGLSRQLDFLSHLQRVEAEVVAVETHSPDDPFTKHTPHVRFTLPSGESMNVVAADTYRPTVAGERLTIGYDSRDPTDARLMDPRDEWIIPVYPLIFGIVTIALAYRRRQGERASTD